MSLLGGFLLPATIAAAIAISPLRPVSLREIGLVLVGMVLAAAAAAATKNRQKPSRRFHKGTAASPEGENEHIIETIQELRDLMPAGASGTCLEDAKKVIGYLDDQMIRFVSKSPLLYLATLDAANNAPFVSPKGDEPGFVTVRSNESGGSSSSSSSSNTNPRHTLIIPDRPGNRLLFGLQNIVDQRKSESNTSSQATTNSDTNTADATAESKRSKQHPPRVSILFEVPGTGTTLRCGGTARLSTDPALLEDHTARGCLPKLVILVDVDYAFFHCAKAYMRAKVWDPASWPAEPPKVGFGRYFAKEGGILAKTIDSGVDKHYKDVQKAIDGESCESEA